MQQNWTALSILLEKRNQKIVSNFENFEKNM